MEDYQRGGWAPSLGAGGGTALAFDERVCTAPDLRGSLYVWPEGILFVGEHVRSEPHRHFTASLFFAMSGSLRIRVEPKAEWCETRAALIAPNVMQEMDAWGCQLVNLQIDPESDAYARVAPRLLFGPVHPLPDSLADELSTRARAMLREPAWSPARLCVPLRRYILWLRLRQVVYGWALTRSLTEAAHAAGFADSAHLSRTFRSMYGQRPSDVFRSDGRVALVAGFPSRGLRGPHASHDGPLWAHAAAALATADGVRAEDEDHRWLPLG